MQDNQSINKLSKLAIILSIALFVLSIVYLVFSIYTNSPEKFSTNVAINYTTGDNKVRQGSYSYYSGNNFIKLSMDDMSKYEISPLKLLTDVEDIHWMEGGAVFNFSKIPNSPKLSDIISTKIEDLSTKHNPSYPLSVQNIYWYINFSDGAISYLTYTDNPLAISSDPSGKYIYFSNTIIDSGLTYLGMIDKEGVISPALFSSPSDTPVRIINRQSDIIYLLRASTEGTDLISLNISTAKESTVIKDVYSGEQLGIYGDVMLSNSALYLLMTDINTKENYIKTIDISSKSTREIYRSSSSSVLELLDNKTIKATDRGDALSSISLIDTTGKTISSPVIVKNGINPTTIILNDNRPILISRPYISVNQNQYPNAKNINDHSIEKAYSSDNSSLERDIYSETYDINTYYLNQSKGSLKNEYENLVQYAKKIGRDINDITIIPRLGNNATYDLD